jgi:hypothetical protein
VKGGHRSSPGNLRRLFSGHAGEPLGQPGGHGREVRLNGAEVVAEIVGVVGRGYGRIQLVGHLVGAVAAGELLDEGCPSAALTRWSTGGLRSADPRNALRIPISA